MCSVNQKKSVIFNTTNSSCPIGEIIGKKNISESNIPVLSCEGACIRGEIARQPIMFPKNRATVEVVMAN